MIVFWVSDLYCLVIDDILGMTLVYHVVKSDNGYACYMFSEVFGEEFVIECSSLEIACGALHEAIDFLYPDHLNVYLQKVIEDE